MVSLSHHTVSWIDLITDRRPAVEAKDPGVAPQRTRVRLEHIEPCLMARREGQIGPDAARPIGATIEEDQREAL